MAQPYDYQWQTFCAKFLALHPKCKFCKRASKEVDHWVALERGGAKYDLGNLVQMCVVCHREKSYRWDGAFGQQVKDTARYVLPDEVALLKYAGLEADALIESVPVDATFKSSCVMTPRGKVARYTIEWKAVLSCFRANGSRIALWHGKPRKRTTFMVGEPWHCKASNAADAALVGERQAKLAYRLALAANRIRELVKRRVGDSIRSDTPAPRQTPSIIVPHESTVDLRPLIGAS